jgi:hypothetical protein
MTPNIDWFAKLRRDSKGIWGVSSQRNSSRGGPCVSSYSPENCETEDVYIVCNNGISEFKTSKQKSVEMNLNQIADSVTKCAGEFGRSSVRVIIHDFHNANENEQFTLIKTARSIQETTSTLNFQFIFCGAWSYYHFCERYYEINGRTTSPAAEYKNMVFVPPVNNMDLCQLLTNKHIISRVTELDKIACDLLIEQTAGNDYLIDKAIEYLKDKPGSWVNNLEQVINELIAAPEVIQYFRSGINALNQKARDELSKLLEVHRLIRPTDSRITEQLWVAGIVKANTLEGNSQLIQIAGGLINNIIRNIASSVGLGDCAPPKYLCLEGHIISSAAYRKVAEIENILRCLVVSNWYGELGEKWVDNLEMTKTPPHQSESEELINLVLKCMGEEFPTLYENDDSTNDKAIPPQKRKNTQTILDSAKNWQKRQNEHHGVVLAKNNLMHFLTTESLELVLRTKTVGLVGPDKTFAKDYFTTTMEEYRSIRSAVAHNQPIMLVTISRLDDLLRKISEWLTVFIDKQSMDDTPK